MPRQSSAWRYAALHRQRRPVSWLHPRPLLPSTL